MKVLVTGCSSGLGQALVIGLSLNGKEVYATCRASEQVAGIKFLGAKEVLLMDVRQDLSFLNKYAFDVVINNAGYSMWAMVEDAKIEEARTQFDVNFFGVVNVLQNVLPNMRFQGKGIIMNVGSTVVAKPGSGYYAASKAALEALTNNLRIEVAPFGIKVVLLKPGPYDTKYSENRQVVEGRGLRGEYLDNLKVDVPPYHRTVGRDPMKFANMVNSILDSECVFNEYTEL